MTFSEALAMQPAWVQAWVAVLGIVVLGATVILLFSRTTRRDGLIVAAVMIPTAVAVNWMYGQLGYVRFLGLPHVILWTPLVLYLWHRLKDASIVMPFRQMIWLLVTVLMVSLAFDYVDVARYVFGERDSLVPATAS